MLTQEPFTTWCVVGLAPLHGEEKHHILPSMSHYNNLRLSENICIFFRDQPLGSIPRACSRSTTQNYCLTHLSRLKVATSSRSLFVRLQDFIEEQVKLEPFWWETIGILQLPARGHALMLLAARSFRATFGLHPNAGNADSTKMWNKSQQVRVKKKGISDCQVYQKRY